MKKLIRVGAALLAASAAVSPLFAAPVAAQAARNSADERLRALYNGYSAWEAKEFGSIENARGEQERAGYLPHVVAQTQIRREAHLNDLLAKLNAIPAGSLSPDEQVNAAVFRTVLENDLTE